MSGQRADSPRRAGEIRLGWSFFVGVSRHMANEPNPQNRMQYVWPWLGMAAIILALWVAFGE